MTSESHYDDGASHLHEGEKTSVRAAGSLTSPRLFENNFFSRDATITTARKQYLKILIGGVFMTIIIIFSIFPILYGAFYKTPARNLDGWIIDFDGGLIGQTVTNGLTMPNPFSKVTWTIIPANQFPGGAGEVSQAVSEHKVWIAVTINPGVSDRLNAALQSPNATYDGSRAISIFVSEARNDNAFRGLLLPSVQTTLMMISTRFASQQAQAVANSTVLPQLMTVSPQTVLAPMSFQLLNLHPFDQPLAGLVVFVGLLFALILSFVIVMVQYGARERTNLHRLLKFRSLVILRLTTSFVAYFFISLFYSLLSLAFHLNFNKKFGHAGFFIFWMLNLCGMCAVGLAMESMLTLLTIKLIPFFVLLWLMLNVAVLSFPIEVLPIFYRYGYALPFYNLMKAVRTVVFGTKNQVGFNFGVLLIWAVISCITLTIFQYGVRRRDITATRREGSKSEKVNVAGER